MVKVLIIANASNRAKVFIPIGEALIDLGAKVNALSLDGFYDGEASPTLDDSRIPYIEIPVTDDDCLSEMTRDKRFKAIRYWKGFVEELLDSMAPDVILLGAASYLEGAIIESARRKGIKTVLMQDGMRVTEKSNWFKSISSTITNAIRGLVNEWTVGLFGIPYFFSSFWSKRVDLILLFGNTIRDELIRKGFEAEKLLAVGNPVYDSATPIDSRRARDIRWIFKIKENDRVVLFGMQCFNAHGLISIGTETDMVKELIDIFSDMKNIVFIVKLHPNNDYELYRSLFLAWNPPEHIHLIHDELEPSELLGVSDVFMTVYSTMALESLVHGVPVITLDYTPVRYSLSLGKAAISVKSADELKSAILNLNREKIVEMKKERTQALDQELVNLGFASENAAKAIFDLANKKN